VKYGFMRVVFVFTGILLCTLLIVGCVQTNIPVEEKNPARVTTLQDTPRVQNITPLPTTSPAIVPQYQQGDIIDSTRNIDRVPHLIILDFNNTTGQYQYDIIFRNENKSWGYRIYPEPRWVSVGFFEKNETYLGTHINITNLETWFPSKEIFERTR